MPFFCAYILCVLPSAFWFSHGVSRKNSHPFFLLEKDTHPVRTHKSQLINPTKSKQQTKSIKMDREALVYKAKLAEQAERFDEMVQDMYVCFYLPYFSFQSSQTGDGCHMPVFDLACPAMACITVVTEPFVVLAGVLCRFMSLGSILN